MTLKILEEKENSLLNRKEIFGTIDAELTPKTLEILELVGKHFSSNTENIAIKKIKGNFGSKTFHINANIYDSKENKEKIEPRIKIKEAKK